MDLSEVISNEDVGGRRRFEVEQVDNISLTSEKRSEDGRTDASCRNSTYSLASTTVSTQEEMSRRRILTAIGDAGSILGSSVLLSSPSYISIGEQIGHTTLEGSPEIDYMDAILENPEYIDTLEGKLPLAEAARMIAQDSTKHTTLFNEFHVKNMKRQCYKKLFCIGTSLIFLFACFFSLRNLQSSSTGGDKSLGLTTFGCLYSLMWLGGLSACTLVQKLKPKWCLVVASVPFMLYPIANFYPATYTLLPCASLAGFGVGLLWTAEGVYVMNIAATYAFISKKQLIEVIGKFNAVIFSMYQSSHLVGNLLSSIILSDQMFPSTVQYDNATSTVDYNLTTTTISASSTVTSAAKCGLEFYSSESQVMVHTQGTVQSKQKFIFLGIMTSFSLIGFLTLTIFLRPLKTAKIAQAGDWTISVKRFFRLFIKPKTLLLMPYMMYPGLSGSLIMADYTKAYITCAYGIEYIGYILMTGAIFSIAGAFVSGRIIHLTGRIPVFLFMTIISLTSVVILLVWQPKPGSLHPVVFIPVCLWCLADGILLTQINGFLGEIFRKELIFAISIMHICFGGGSAMGTLAMAYSWMSLEEKAYWVIGHLLLGTAAFMVLEMSLRKGRCKV